MSSTLNQQEEMAVSKWSQHRIVILVAITIVISLVLVVVGMVLYNVSGTAQLDLSRPGYEGVSTHIDEDVQSFREYSAAGPIDADSLDEFRQLFTTQAENAKAIEPFSGDPMAPNALGIDESQQERN